MKNHEAVVIEDSGGGLSLFVFGRGGISNGKVIWAHNDYEYNPGQLAQDLNALLDGDNPVTDWDGATENPQENYDQYSCDACGWEAVAKVYDGEIHVYPEKMGGAASCEFENIIRAKFIKKLEEMKFRYTQVSFILSAVRGRHEELKDLFYADKEEIEKWYERIKEELEIAGDSLYSSIKRGIK